MASKDDPHKESKLGGIRLFKSRKAFKDFTDEQKEWQVGEMKQCKDGLKGCTCDKPEADLWKHKSTGMRCHTCMYFVTKEKTLGRCRRHAPRIEGWPAVYEQDWCGDHKLDKDNTNA